MTEYGKSVEYLFLLIFKQEYLTPKVTYCFLVCIKGLVKVRRSHAAGNVIIQRILSLFQGKGPKAVISIKDLNATFQTEKIGHPHGLQVTYRREGRTRNLFVYHESGKVRCSAQLGIRDSAGQLTTSIAHFMTHSAAS
jgi:hypothetical protein